VHRCADSSKIAPAWLHRQTGNGTKEISPRRSIVVVIIIIITRLHRDITERAAWRTRTDYDHFAFSLVPRNYREYN